MFSRTYLTISDNSSWSLALQSLSGARRIAFDLEGDFDLYRYGKHLCLFQIALDSGETFIIDPLVLSDLTELWSLLEDPAVEKVIWGAQNDVRVLKACVQCSMTNVVDLWEAAKCALTPRPSLPTLIDQFFHETIEKKEEIQTSDWNLRPLSTEQLEYAAQDVRYLLALWDVLSEKIRDAKQEKNFSARMRTLESFVFSTTDEPWMKVKGSGSLSPPQKERLRSLYLVRDEIAKSRDHAPWRVVSNEHLIALACDNLSPTAQDLDPAFSGYLLSAKTT